MRNLLLYSIILFTSATCLAQLYVKPNGTTASYVFVKNQIVFVEQDVNLEKNKATVDGTNDYEASIYLREKAQLIQGASNSSNKGTGVISVYQDSNSDSYDYNYWSSPVGDNFTLPGNATVAGNKPFGPKQMFVNTSNTKSNQSTLTSSVNSSTSDASPNLEISNRWLYTFLAGAGFQSAKADGAVPTGQGFTMKGTGVEVHSNKYVDPNNQNYDFRGRPNNGTIAVAVANQLETLSGNPYPSALDLAKVMRDNPSINSFRFWDEDRSINSHLYIANQGGYGTYIPPTTDAEINDPNNFGTYTTPTFFSYNGDGTETTGTNGRGLDINRRYAPIGQGYMVIGSGSAPTMLYKNSQRLYQPEQVGKSEFLRQSNANGDDDTGTDSGPDDTGTDEGDGTNIPDSRTPFLRLYTHFGDSHYRDMILFLTDEATDGYDVGFDATHPYDAGGDDAYFYIHDNGQTYYLVIQGVNYTIDKKVAIAFNLNQQTKISLQAVEQIKLPGLKAYLYDNIEDTYKQITGGRDAYVQLPAGNYEDRFYIAFKSDRDDILAVEETTQKVSEKILMVQDNKNQVFEIRNPENYALSAVNIFDISGKLVIDKANLGSEGRYSFPTSNLSDGIYIVKLITKDNLVIDNKIQVFNRR